MTDLYFYQDSGQTMGPVSYDELRLKIRAGGIKAFDLMFKEGDSNWRMAIEHPEFQGEFKTSGEETRRSWICLQRKAGDMSQFQTKGPFSTEDVRKRLLSGQLSYSDYLWRSGFSEWKRIGLIEEFNARMAVAADEGKVPEVVPEALLKNVVELRRPRVVPLVAPAEAQGEDQTKVFSGPPPAPAAKVGIRLKTKKMRSVGSPRRQKVPWFDWGIVGVLVLVMASVGLVLSRYIRRHKTANLRDTTVETQVLTPHAPIQPTAPPAPPVQAVEPPGPKAQEVEIPSAEENEVNNDEDVMEPESPSVLLPAKRTPTRIHFRVEKVKGGWPQVQVTTNGIDFPVYVQFLGLPGQVAEGPSFYKFLKFHPKPGESKTIDLSKVKVPAGRYIVRATSGDVRKEVKVSFSTADEKFRANLARQRKLHSPEIWSERLTLIQLSHLLDTRIAEAVSGKKFSAKGLEPIDTVDITNRRRLILFDDWFALKTILQDARHKPTQLLATKARQEHDHLVSYSIWK